MPIYKTFFTLFANAASVSAQKDPLDIFKLAAMVRKNFVVGVLRLAA